jgi:spartin
MPPPLPPRENVRALTTKDRVLISADLILSTIDHSTRQLINAGTQQVGKIVDHKYGPEAAESSVLMANTARNAGLVYVDMRGIGRRALLKRAGRTYIKTKLSSNRPAPTEVAPISTPTGK